jgi:hypothetical protein
MRRSGVRSPSAPPIPPCELNDLTSGHVFASNRRKPAWHTFGTVPRVPMATFRKRGASWHVQIRRAEHPALTRSFRHKADAEAWARQVEAGLDRGDAPGNRRLLKGQTLGDLLNRYRASVTPKKKGAPQEGHRLNWLLRHPIEVAAWGPSGRHTVTWTQSSLPGVGSSRSSHRHRTARRASHRTEAGVRAGCKTNGSCGAPRGKSRWLAHFWHSCGGVSVYAGPTAIVFCRADRLISAVRRFGAVAQLGERRVRNAEVRGSIPLGSTNPAAGTASTPRSP